MPRKYLKQPRIPVASCTLYSQAAQAAAPDCLWLAQHLPGLLDRLQRLAAPPSRQAIAKITGMLERLQLAMQAEQAAAADIRVPKDFRKRHYQPVRLKVVVAHPLALAVIQLLADLDETALKWDWRYQETAGSFDYWYQDKTQQWLSRLHLLAAIAQKYWRLFEKQDDAGARPGQTPGLQPAGEGLEEKTMSRLALWLLVLSLAVAPLACDQARSRFDQISLGMTRQQVEQLLGKPATVTGDPAAPTATWIYGQEKLVIRFHQDRVQLKQLAPAAQK